MEICNSSAFWWIIFDFITENIATLRYFSLDRWALYYWRLDWGSYASAAACHLETRCKQCKKGPLVHAWLSLFVNITGDPRIIRERSAAIKNVHGEE